MRIAQVAPLYESVPPRLYGGTERVVSWLTEELVRRGHQVTLFATGDSKTDAELVVVAERALRLDPTNPEPSVAHALELGEVFARAGDFDVVHSHLDFLAFPGSRRLGPPVVHTLHGRLDLPYLQPLYRHFHDLPLVSISDAQRGALAGLGVRWAATVHHGLPIDQYAFSPQPEGYLAFLGRISPEKRPDLAIAVARRLGLPLRIAAKVDAADRAYFAREIEPLLAGGGVEYLGEIGGEAKAAFLGGALALLFPIDWPEPFGLVMIEALACGTPVVARPCGSVPEIIRDGETGLLADTVEELAAAVMRVERIDRRRCRQHAEERFSSDVMAARYESVYSSLAALR
jgi:glycosyltransferase involved in cell wall biosynthesis